MTKQQIINKAIQSINKKFSFVATYLFKLACIMIVLIVFSGMFPDLIGFIITMFFSPLGIIIAGIVLYRALKRKNKTKRTRK